MGKTVYIIGSGIVAARRAYARKGVFSALTLAVFIGATAVLARYDLLPEPKPATLAVVPQEEAKGEIPREAKVEEPEKIEIPSIGLSASIKNPSSTNVKVLDNALLSGAVRYPTSAKLGQDGNVVLFAHSSYLPVVLNPAFKTFNGIQKLKAGDTVTVYSSSMAYTYRVKSMTKENANDAGIPLAVAGKRLTLSTCDSFGTKSDRFVVVADFVDSRPLGV